MAETGHEQSKAFQVIQRLANCSHSQQQKAKVGDSKRVAPVVVGHIPVAFLHHQQEAGQGAPPKPKAFNEAKVL